MHENLDFWKRLEIITDLARENFGEPVDIVPVGVSCFKIALPDRIIKARWNACPGRVESYERARQIVALPDILLLAHYQDIGVRFLEWWKGYTFDKLSWICGGRGKIPLEHFRRYGEFLAELRLHNIYPWDTPWNNVLLIETGDVVFCDDEGLLDNDEMNYIERFLDTATPQQQAAFHEGYAHG